MSSQKTAPTAANAHIVGAIVDGNRLHCLDEVYGAVNGELGVEARFCWRTADSDVRVADGLNLSYYLLHGNWLLSHFENAVRVGDLVEGAVHFRQQVDNVEWLYF